MSTGYHVVISIVYRLEIHDDLRTEERQMDDLPSVPPSSDLGLPSRTKQLEPLLTLFREQFSRFFLCIGERLRCEAFRKLCSIRVATPRVDIDLHRGVNSDFVLMGCAGSPSSLPA